MNLKVSMDLDGCLCDFYGSYFARFGKPEKDSEITRNVQTVLPTCLLDFGVRLVRNLGFIQSEVQGYVRSLHDTLLIG